MIHTFAANTDLTIHLEPMLFGERLAGLRKKKKISQDELAKTLGVHAPIIGRYERGQVNPSVEVAAKIANALEVSLDYLVGATDQELDKSILNKVLDIQQLNDDDKLHIITTLDALLRDAKARKAYK